jgi:hypothetical protein
MAALYEHTKNIEGKYLNRKAKVNNRAVHYTNKQIAMAENLRKDGLTNNLDIRDATGVNIDAMSNKKTTKCFKQYTTPDPYRKQWKNYMYDRHNKIKDTHNLSGTVGWGANGDDDYWWLVKYTYCF